MNLPVTCLKCPNLEALRIALLEEDLGLLKEKLDHILKNLDGTCTGKCAEEKNPPQAK